MLFKKRFIRPVTIIHISDLHCNTSADRGALLRSRLDRLRRQFPTSHLIATGDLTNSGSEAEYMQLDRIIEQWRDSAFPAAHVIPGNHDYAIWGNLLDRDAVRRWRRRYGAGSYMCAVTSQVMLFALDSADPGGREWFARGVVVQSALDVLSVMLRRHRDKFRIVALHHHPFHADPLEALSNTSALFTAIRRGKGCELLLFGHKHVLGEWEDPRYRGRRCKVRLALAADALYNVNAHAWIVHVRGRRDMDVDLLEL